MPIRVLRSLLFTGILALCGQAGATGPVRNTDPDVARLVVEDLQRFWRAYDTAAQARTPAARAGIYQRDYLEAGSAGLKAFTTLRIGDGRQLAATIDRHPRYYAALREQTGAVAAHEADIRAAFRKLASLHPGAVFPDVYLLVGRMNSGGTLTDAGLLIGLEMYGRTAATPTEELGEWHLAVLRDMHGLPHIVAHELVHYQQRYPTVETPTLLQMAINEGVADFIAELISGRHINPHVHAWAEPRARQLWREFRQVMHGTDPAGWLYDTTPGEGRPADLGYWMGYRIARAYYEGAPDPAQAVRDMLAIQDFEQFLARSGLAASLEPAQEGAASH